jgi:hypothetical protein
MAMPAISVEKIDDLKDAALRDQSEQSQLVTMGVQLDTVDDYVTAQYRLLAPVAGLDATVKPRVAVWVETLEDTMLHGAYEIHMVSPMHHDYLEDLGTIWGAVIDRLEVGDGSIPWTGELLVDPIEV